MAAPLHATLDQATKAPIPPGFRSAELMRHGSMVLRYYAPKGSDPQTPHEQDEIYIVVGGSGEFTAEGQVYTFAPGDALFVPAGVEHRFTRFTPDFVTWVIFYGPKGGEAGG